MLADNEGMREKRKLLHCCYMWRHSWCEGLEALCSQISGGCPHTGVPYLLYKDSGQFLAISQLFTIFTLMEEKQLGEWSNCSLRKETDKVVKTCQNHILSLRSRTLHLLSGLFLSVSGLTSGKKTHNFSLFTDIDFNKILWWVDPGWMLGAQQSQSVTPLPSWTGERKQNKILMGGDKDREKSPTSYQLVNMENGLPWEKSRM